MVALVEIYYRNFCLRGAILDFWKNIKISGFTGLFKFSEIFSIFNSKNQCKSLGICVILFISEETSHVVLRPLSALSGLFGHMGTRN